MAKAPLRTPVPGPAFIRLLARLTDVDVPPSSQALAGRLSLWIDWTRAVALSRALDNRVPDAEAVEGGADPVAECARLRGTLVDSIRLAPELQPGPATDAADYAPFRQRYLDLQRAMQSATGYLRGRLRALVALQSPALARLAEIDAVMELTLSPREYTLLGAVPDLLGRHHARLHDAAADTGASSAWCDLFRNDMQNVLMAELDVRFQPIEALLAALRTR